MLLKRQDVFVHASKQKAAIIFKARHLCKVVRAILRECRRIGAAARVFGLEERSVGLEAPAMEGADHDRLVAALAPAEFRAAMRTGVDQRIDAPIPGAGEHHGNAADPGGEKIVRFRQLAFMREIDPIVLEDMFHLQIEQLGVGKGIAPTTESAGFDIVDDRGGDTVAQGGIHGLSSLCGCLFGGRAAPRRKGFAHRVACPLQFEIEGDVGAVALPTWQRKKTFARAESEVVGSEGIVPEIDLGR